MFTFFINLLKILLLILYFVFIFYVEFFYKGVFIIKINIKSLNELYSIKTNIVYRFIINIDICNFVRKFFNRLNALNIDFNIKIDLFSRPNTNLRLFLFYSVYNFVACYIICCVTWAFHWRTFTAHLRYLDFLPKDYMDLSFKTAPYFMFLLITSEFLIILIILCFMWWKFEYTVLMPLNLFIILYYFYCFLFSFFWKAFICLSFYLINNFILFILKFSKYSFKNVFINFFNGLWPWVKQILWCNSSIFVKVCICIYVFITFNFFLFYFYLFLFNIIIFY